MKHLLLATVAALLALAEPARASYDVAEVLQKFDDGTPVEKSVIKGSLKANVDGFATANWDLKNNGKSPLYCEPIKIYLTDEQLIDILRRWAKAHPTNLPTAMALLLALKDAFPCTK